MTIQLPRIFPGLTTANLTRFRRPLALFLLCLGLSAIGHGQNSRYDGIVWSRNGFPSPGASIDVCSQPASISSTAPYCTPLASLCSSATDAVCASPNPVTADSMGNFHFYVKPGVYSLESYNSSLSPFLQADQVLSCPPGISCSLGAGTFITLTSATANPALTGQINLAKSDCIKFRNNANGADVSLCLDSSDRVAATTFAATTVATDTVNNKTAGNALTLQGKNGVAALGDNVQVQGGTGGNGGSGGAGGSVTVSGGGTTSGGDVTISGGNAVPVGNGGNVTITPGLPAGGGGAGTVLVNGLVSKYNSIALVSNGIPSEVAGVDLTAQNAAITTTTLYAVPASGAGQYRLSWDAKVTTAAGTSSTLGALTITYTDPDGVVVGGVNMPGWNGGSFATTNTANTTGTVLIGSSMLLNCKAGTNITYAMGYASNAASAMQYNLHIKLEAQ